jgi:hypothetical protein
MLRVLPFLAKHSQENGADGHLSQGTGYFTGTNKWKQSEGWTSCKKVAVSFEALASISSLVVGLFIESLLVDNYVISSGSVEDTLLSGDHVVFDQLMLRFNGRPGLCKK